MKKIRIGLLALAILATSYGLYELAIWHLSDGFSIAKISSNLSYSSKWDVKNSSPEVVNLLDQNFYYLAKGSQCFVFESEDKQLVLKFFRHSRYRLPSFSKRITCPPFLCDIQNQKKKLKQQKLNDLFQSCKLAFTELRDETGLIYLHLNKTSHLKKQVTLYDKLKRAHTINMDDYEFVLQLHAEHIFPHLSRLIERGKIEETKESLDSLIALLFTRLNKNIADHDAVIHKNSGFRGNKALFLDIGGFVKESCPDYSQELRDTTKQLRHWLSHQDPTLASYLDSFGKY